MSKRLAVNRAVNRNGAVFGYCFYLFKEISSSTTHQPPANSICQLFTPVHKSYDVKGQT